MFHSIIKEDVADIQLASSIELMGEELQTKWLSHPFI